MIQHRYKCVFWYLPFCLASELPSRFKFLFSEYSESGNFDFLSGFLIKIYVTTWKIIFIMLYIMAKNGTRRCRKKIRKTVKITSYLRILQREDVSIWSGDFGEENCKLSEIYSTAKDIFPKTRREKYEWYSSVTPTWPQNYKIFPIDISCMRLVISFKNEPLNPGSWPPGCLACVARYHTADWLIVACCKR